jgi:transposase
VEKARDVVGLYLDPPEKALVLCVDEKSRIQALDRTQRSLPLNYGRPETRAHAHRRYGTTTLFAALDGATGEVVGKVKRRRSVDFISFLRHVDGGVSDELKIHMILDNYGTHQAAKVKQWLLRQRRFHSRFAPTCSSWINLVERFLASLTEQQLRRGARRSAVALEKAIRDCLNIHNERPKPFRWTKSAHEIIESVRGVRR